MMILTNTSAENAYDSSLFPSAVTPVQLEEQENRSLRTPLDETATTKQTEDTLTLSPDAIKALARSNESEKSSEKKNKSSEDTGSNGEELPEEDKKVVEELKARDQEVRTHEQAHIAAGGQHVMGGASFDYQSGPDGKRYAVGGHVNIDTSPVADDPDATIRKMQTVRAAAMAPAEPSGQDRSVAAQANQAIAQAQQEKATEAKEKSTENTNESESTQNEAASTSSTPESIPQQSESSDNNTSAQKPAPAAGPYTQQLQRPGSAIDFAA